MMLSTAPTGTQIKFSAVTGNDTMVKNGISKEITTKLMCVTAMQQYQGKSLEELRVEDYQANRKFPTAGSTTSVFGGGGTTSGFGSTGTSSAFGGGTSLFGGTQQQSGGTGSFFGNTAAKPSIFGGTSTSTPSIGGGLFGSSTTTANQPQTSSLFGNTAAKPAGSLFGNTAPKPSLFGGTSTTPTGGSLFGGGTVATSQPSTGLFGSTQPAAGATNSFFGGGNTAASTFGSTNTSTAFGSTSGSLFGGNQQRPATGTTGSLFGNTAAKPSIFGGTATSTPSIGGGLFGNTATTTTQPAGGGLFGNTAAKPVGSMFGNTVAKPLSFGAPSATTTGGLFGGGTAATTQQPSTGFFGGTTFGQQPAATQIQQPQSLVTQQPIVIGGDSSEAAIRQAIIESQLAMYPYGDSHLLRSFSLKSDEESVKEAVKQQMEKERQNESYFALKLGKQDTPKEADTGAKRYQQSVLSAGRPSVFNYKPLVQRNGFAATDLNVSADTSQATVEQPPSLNDSFKIPKSNLFVPSLSSLSKKRDNPKHLDLSVLSDAVQENNRSVRLSSVAQTGTDIHTSSPLPTSIKVAPARTLNFDLTTSPQLPTSANERSPASRANTSLDDSLQHLTTNNITQEEDEFHDITLIQGPVGIVLSKRDIYTEPPLDELDRFVQDGKVHLVDGFVVGRLGYGRIEWPGAISFSNVDLGDLVRFQRKQVIVYPDETKKPPIGEEFNRKAIITLENIFPYNKETKEEIRDPLSEEAQLFSRILERKCLKMDCDFLEYDAEKGIWQFRVKHFSRYGFFEDEEDDSTAAQPPKRHKAEPKPLKTIQENVDEQAMETGGESPVNVRLGKTLGFDESIHEATNFIDPKSLFVSNFDEAKFKRLGIAEDIIDFIEPSALRDVQVSEKSHPIRRRVRTISKFTLDDKVFSDLEFKHVVRLHGHPLARRVGFGPSTNTFVTALLDFEKATNHVLVSKLKLVPTIEAYLINYLKSMNRESDFEQLMQTSVLCMKPPSEFLRLIDAYLFGELRVHFSLDVINEKMHRFCEAICQDLSDVRFDILQRHAFTAWLREELYDDLEKKLESLRLTNKVSPYAAVFQCLHYGFIEKAVEVAAENGLSQLSLFIGLYINGRVSGRLSQYAKKMFDSMKQVNNADPFRRRVYAILSRLLIFTHSNTTVDLVRSASNIQVLALQLNYFAPRKSSLNDSMGELNAINSLAA